MQKSPTTACMQSSCQVYRSGTVIMYRATSARGFMQSFVQSQLKQTLVVALPRQDAAVTAHAS